MNNYILHVTIGFGGGIGTFLKNLITYQIDMGYKVGVVYTKRENQFDRDFEDYFLNKIDKFPIKNRKIKGLNQLFGINFKNSYKQVVNVYPNYRVLVHFHNVASLGLITKMQHYSIICTVHGLNTVNSSISKMLTKKILKKLIKKNKKINCVSEYISRYYSSILHTNKILTIKNGIKLSHDKKLYNFSKFSVGFLGYLSDLKGWDYIVDGFLLIPEEYRQQMELVIAGMGTEKEVNKLKKILQNNPGDNITYLGVVKDAGNVLTPALDLVILPSLSEGLGLTLIESIGHGIPILATNVGGIPEVLVEGKNGYFIKRDANDIKNMILYLYQDKDLYKKMAIFSKTYFNKNFTLEIMGNKYSKLYEDILKEEIEYEKSKY